MDALGQLDLVPERLGVQKIVLYHQRAVDGADGNAGYRVELHAELAHGFPCAKLIGAFCAAACKDESVGFH